MIGANSATCAGCAILDHATLPMQPGPADCWAWCGARRGGNGGVYGMMRVDRSRVRSAHRVAFAAWRAPIVAHWDVRHTKSCGNALCVRPDHLVIARVDDRVGVFVPWHRGAIRPGGRRVWGEALAHVA